jgi:hypothetical protein
MEEYENLQQIDRDVENARMTDFPLEISGRILKDDEKMEDINTGDKDTVIVEVIMDHEKMTWWFTPREEKRAEKKHKEKGSIEQIM